MGMQMYGVYALYTKFVKITNWKVHFS